MTDPRIRDIADALTKQFLSEGRLVEAGFRGLILTAYPGHALMPTGQHRMLREAFFAGAQHLFGCIMSSLDPGEEPTKADLDRISSIAAELDKFIAEYARDHVPTRGSA